MMNEFARILLAAIVAYFVLKFLSVYIKWITSPLWSLPGPPRSTWLFGKFLTIAGEPFLEPHKRWVKDAGGYDNNPVIHYTNLGGMHSLMILDADLVRKILFSNYGKNPPRFEKRLQVLVPLTGYGLVTLDGEDWQRHRRIIHPSFQPKSIKASLDAAVPDLVNKLILYWKKAGEGKEIDATTHFSNLTLDIIGKVAFSHEFRALESVEKWACGTIKNDEELPPITDRLIVTMDEMLKKSRRHFLLTNLKLSALNFTSRKISREMNATVDKMINAARAKVVERKVAPESESQNIGGKAHLPRSLLQTLFDAKDNTDPSTHTRKFLDDSELRDEIKTFILAGHETTATWCYWAAFALCQYPDVQDKVYNDVIKHSMPAAISRAGEGDVGITVESVEKMPYLDAFLKEILRMYPPVGMVIRSAVNDETIHGINIPANTRIIIPIHLLHRHPKYWDEPETFKPERWLKGDGPPVKHKQAYIPFSDGPRNCIGYHFATIEAKLIVAHLVRHFIFRLAPSVSNEKFTFYATFTTKSKPNLKVCVRPRTAR